MLAVNNDGKWMTRDTLDIEDHHLTNLIFDESKVYQFIDPDELVLPIIFEVVEPGTYIGVRSDPSSIEMFFVAQVCSKEVSDDYKEDAFGHKISKNEPYFVVRYLERTEEKKTKIKFKLSKSSPGYLHLAEVFATNIEIEEDLSMRRNEYQSLCSELFN